MRVREIDGKTFSEYASTHPLKNYFQTREYGALMRHSDYGVMYIGAFEKEQMLAASLILYKTIGTGIKYGYAPRGFLVDYYNTDLLKKVTKSVKEFFFRKGFAFIKVNPEVTLATVDYNTQSKTINPTTKELIKTLKTFGYDKLKDNLYFESLLPKFTPVIYLPTFLTSSLDANMREELSKTELSGIKLRNGDAADIETFYSFVKGKDGRTLSYYKFFYETFSKNNMIDLILVEINYDTYVKFLQKLYAYEAEKNEKINALFQENPNDNDLYNQKMQSDKKVSKVSADINLANLRMSENTGREILGGALVIKQDGRVTILESGHREDFMGIDVKTYLYYKIITAYKDANYLYLDLNGITGDFTDSNPYKELNDFKLKFNPTVYEYIGEFDLIVNKPFHQFLWSTNKIQKEFYRPAIKK